MDYSEFVSVITARKPPELPELERVTTFANAASKEVLWTALSTTGIHGIYQALVTQALQRRILEALALEQEHQRKLEEEVRSEAIKPASPRKGGR
jgi:hypothetical protein